MSESIQEFEWGNKHHFRQMPPDLIEFLNKETSQKNYTKIIWGGKSLSVGQNEIREYISTSNQSSDRINIIGSVSTKETTDHVQKGEIAMNDRDYVDLKIGALESNMSQQLKAQGELFTEKINHIDTKIDSNQQLLANKLDNILLTLKQEQELQKIHFEKYTDEKLKVLSDKLNDQQKQNKNNTWMITGVVAAVATLIATVVIPFFS